MSTCVAALYAAAGGPPASGTPAQQLVDDWASGGAGSDGFAMVFEDAGGTDAPSIYIKDSGTPANDTDINLTDDFDAFNSFLTYTSPSSKIVRQSDGNLKYCAHNLVLHSQAFDNAAWSATGSPTLTSGQTDPDGGSNAYTFAASSGVDTKISQISLPTAQTGTRNAYSITVRYNAGSGWIILYPLNQVSDAAVWFDVQNGTKGTEQTNAAGSSITDLGGGWYRCEVLWPTANANAAQFVIELASSNGATIAGATDSVDIYAAQFYRTPADTTYLPTTTAARYALPIQYDSSNNAEGLLVEPAATNLVTYSEWFSSGWTYTNSTRDDNGGAGYSDPTGGNRAVKQIANNLSTTSQQVGNSISFSSGTIYTASVFAKKVDTGFKDVAIIFSGRLAEAFDLDAETSSNFAEIGWSKVASGVEDIDGSWKRCWVTFNTEAITASVAVRFDVENTGDGTSGILFWGAQVETGSVPTSPIITTGATATRAVDQITKALASTPFDNATGTAYVKAKPYSWNSNTGEVMYAGGTNGRLLYYIAATTQLRTFDGTNIVDLVSTTPTLNTDFKAATKWSVADGLEGSYNGATTVSGSFDGSMGPGSGNLTLGANSTAQTFHGLYKEILILPENLSDADIESITT